MIKTLSFSFAHEPAIQEKAEEVDFETAIHFARYGKFQKFLLAICGLIYTTCAISTTTLSFVLPSAECDFNLSSNDKGRLSATPLIGMIFGCCLWGVVADSRGRKIAMILSLLVDFLAGFVSSFARTYTVFLVCRFFNGFGIIGATSLAFSYLGEFLPNKTRDKVLSRLELFWNIGVIVLPAIAWTLLNKSAFERFSEWEFINPWRVFVFICSLPSLISVICLCFLPETPKFLLLKGKYKEAKAVFQTVYRINTGMEPTSFPVLTLWGEGNNNDKNIEIKTKTSFLGRLQRNILDGLKELKQLCHKPYITYLGITALSDFGLMASYFTLMMWFPEIFERFKNFENTHKGEKAGICEVSEFLSNRTTNLQLLMKDCEPSINTRVFAETIFIGLCCIPSSLSLNFFMSKMGKKYVLMTGLILSGMSALCLNWVSSTEETLLLSATFEALTCIIETVIFCIVVELFPTNLRAPALVITATCGRTGAILGNLMFGMLIDIQCHVPIYVFGATLIGCGVLSLGIPKSDEYASLH